MYTPSRCGCTLLAVLPTEIAERVNGPFADLLYSYQHMYAHALSLSLSDINALRTCSLSTPSPFSRVVVVDPSLTLASSWLVT